MADKTPNFGSAEEEVKYWREQALMFQKGMLEAREELEEFQVIVLRPLTRPRTLNILETSTLARPNRCDFASWSLSGPRSRTVKSGAHPQG